MSNQNNSPSADKLKALQLAMDKIEKDHGKDTIMKLGNDNIEEDYRGRSRHLVDSEGRRTRRTTRFRELIALYTVNEKRVDSHRFSRVYPFRFVSPDREWITLSSVLRILLQLRRERKSCRSYDLFKLLIISDII